MADTVFDEDESTLFGTKIFWLAKIMKNYSIFKNEINKSNGVGILQKLNDIRKLGK